MTRAFLSATALALLSAPAFADVHGIAPGGDLPGFFDCLRENDAIVLSAHRGGPAPGYPENAIETFEHTLSRIPAILEVDVQPSADGVLMLMHDDTLDRTTTGAGPLPALSFAELRELRLRDNGGAETGFLIPTLEEALNWAEGRTILVMDRKAGTPFDAIVAAVRAADAMDRVIWATYSDEEVEALVSIAPEAMIVAAMDGADDLDRLTGAGAAARNLVTWSGTETPQPELYAALADRGVESAFATLGNWTGSWDNRIAVLADDTLYRRITAGAHVLATDRMFEAYAALPRAAAAQACGVE